MRAVRGCEQRRRRLHEYLSPALVAGQRSLTPGSPVGYHGRRSRLFMPSNAMESMAPVAVSLLVHYYCYEFFIKYFLSLLCAKESRA